MPESPWREDTRTWETFSKEAEAVSKLLGEGERAMELKAKGNKAFQSKSYEAALDAWANARTVLVEAGIDGHHLAALWSNDANCRKKMGDIEGCRTSCNEGLKVKCTTQIREKLQFHLKSVDPDAIAAVEEASPPTVESKVEAATKTTTTRSEMKKGFFGDAKGELYGPEGSKQGQMPQSYKHPVNGGEAIIDVPINQPGGKGPSIMPIMISPPHSPRSDDEAG
jgi:hypothetical protein